MKLLTKLFAAATLVAAAQANAVVIDFGSSAWTPAANNQSSYTVNYAETGNVTATAGPSGSLLFANDPVDGLGVTSGEIDEIDLAEFITVTFQKTVSIVSIKLTDLFPRNHASEGNATDGNDPVYGEVAHVFFYLGAALVGSKDVYGLNSTGGNGEQTFTANNIIVDKIVFQAGGSFNEYSVKHIKAVKAPEPGVLALLGLGLMGLGMSRRRQSKQA